MLNETPLRSHGSASDALRRCWGRVRLLFTPLMACIVLMSLESGPVNAEQTGSRTGFIELDREIQTLKQEFIDLKRELSLLEEELSYPAAEQLVVFVSLTQGTPVTPSLVKIALDGEVLTHHRYAGNEIEALRRGGVHRLWTGKVTKGRHNFEVALIGSGAKGHDVHRQSTKSFSSGRNGTYIALRIEASGTQEGPEFHIDVW